MDFPRNHSPGLTAGAVSLLIGLTWLVPLEAGSPVLDETIDGATRIVLSQLKKGTLERDEAGFRLPWISQPGAIRNFDGRRGRLHRLYKLYSAAEMSVGDVAPLDEDRPSDWWRRPAVWIDLNEPIVGEDGTKKWPIADPTVSAEGFTYQPSPVENPLPMPVRWLYRTRDGTMGPLGRTGRFIPVVPGLTGEARPATADNPLVARVAFWTDDPTTKINLNTASEGVFWDSPRCDTTEERAYAARQPANGEWQRDMGHPAAVCLSSVLFPGRRLSVPVEGQEPGDPLPLADARILWRFARGVLDGGTLGGSVATPHDVIPSRRDIDHVYTSVEDAARSAELTPALREKLRRSAFLLTTHSRGSDLTVAGTPRISIWPVDASWPAGMANGPSDGGRVSRFDLLTAAVSKSTQGHRDIPYFVHRQDPTSQNNELYGLADGRNRDLWRYLQGLTSNSGGMGRETSNAWPNPFQRKYGGGLRNDLAAVFGAVIDYVRCANLFDSTLLADQRFGARGQGLGQVTPLNFSGGVAADAVTWASMDNASPRGFGRMATVSEVSLVLSLRTWARSEAGAATSAVVSPWNQREADLYQGQAVDFYEYDVSVVLEGFCPAHSPAPLAPDQAFLLGGYSGSTEFFRTTRDPFGRLIRDIGKMDVSGKLLNFPVAPASAPVPAISIAQSSGLPENLNSWGGYLGSRFASRPIQFNPLLFVVPTHAQPPSFRFSGTAAGFHPRLLIYRNHVETEGPPLQFFHFPFPSVDSLTMPVAIASARPFSERYEEMRQSGSYAALGADSIVQSLAVGHGDFRHTSQRRNNGILRQAGLDWQNEYARNHFVGLPSYGRARQALGWNEALWGQISSSRDPMLQLNHYLRDVGESIPDSVRPDFPLLAPGSWTVPLVAPLDSTMSNYGALRGGHDATVEGEQLLDLQRLDGIRTADETVFRRGNAHPDITGDFDNGLSIFPDGPYINAPDCGDARALRFGGTPYFDNVRKPWVDNPGHFSPYRQVPSPVMFGSLPTGVQVNVPWQTLLFRPDANRGTPNEHYGSTTIPDSYLLDFFRMPVVQPSTPVDWKNLDETWMPSDFASTAGRINMNYALVPFAHIHRATALHALLKPQKILAIPDSAGAIYKSGAGRQDWRHYLDSDETLRQWEARFAAGDVFRHPADVCGLWLVPEGARLEDMPAFWARHRLTGDNSKERPYAHLYPHLTTRSTTFEMHVVAQSLDLAAGSAPDSFAPGVDRITGESRDRLIIRSHLDSSTPGLPDYAAVLMNDPDARFTSADERATWFIERPDTDAPPDMPELSIEAAETVEPLPEEDRPPYFQVRFHFTAPLGQLVELESSADLETWRRRGLYAGAGRGVAQAIEWIPDASDPSGEWVDGLFFRLRSRTVR